MASLRKQARSPYWFACFTLPDGRRTNRSTGTGDRRKAQRIANAFEDAAKEGAEGRLIEARARKTISDIFALSNSQSLPSSTVSDYLKSWLKRKELEASEKTHLKYSSVVAQFLEHLGARASREVSAITGADFSGFRDAASKRLSVGTVNVALKILRSAFTQAKRDGLVDVNEAERVTLLKRRDRHERRPFTLEELKRVLDVADTEWRGMILFGLYTGQRLGDVARLTWRNIDLERKELGLATLKTNRRQIIPMAAPLASFLEKELMAGEDPASPLFPNIHETTQRHVASGYLSNQFFNILVKAGLAEKRSHKSVPNSRGRAVKRKQNELSFHSLRHTATTLLKAAGVSDSVAMEFVGHDSKSVSRNYTHIPTDTLRAAASSLPDVTR